MSGINLVSKSQAAIFAALAIAVFWWHQASGESVDVKARSVDTHLAKAAAPIATDSTLTDVQRALAALPTSEPQPAPRRD